MVKTILKEIFILILLLAAIVLGLGVLMYDYIPNNKIVPTILQYETPENISEELNEAITENNQEIIVTYEVDSQDLNIYEKTKQYNAGNPNPFSYYTTENGNVSTNNVGTNNSNNVSNPNNSNSTKDDGTFFENKGTK